MKPSDHELKQAKRVPVTAEWLWMHPDVQGWYYKETEFGDPWIPIEGVDMLTDGSKIILDYARTKDVQVDKDYMVYASQVQVDHAKTLDLDFADLETRVIAGMLNSNDLVKEGFIIPTTINHDPKLQELIDKSETPEQREFWRTVQRGYHIGIGKKIHEEETSCENTDKGSDAKAQNPDQG